MKLADIFTDGAVLQRNSFIPVWGKTAPGAAVRAELDGKTAFAKASAAGDFMLRLPPMCAGGPFELKVSSDKGEAVVRDVLIGEVWVASGQSNMEHPLGGNWAAHEDNSLHDMQEKEFHKLNICPDKLRAVNIPQTVFPVRETGFDGSWRHMTPENAANTSAAGIWFGCYLQQKLGVPVGIINSSFGGTCAEAWTSRSGLLSNPDTASLPELCDREYLNEDVWANLPSENDAQALFAAMCQKDRPNEGVKQGWAEPGFDGSDWDEMQIPGSWVKQKISGNGAVWIRRNIEIPESWAGKELTFNLSGVDKHDITYFNGVEVGRTGKDLETEYWNQPRHYNVPGNLVKAGKNTLAVRGFSFAYDGSFNGDPAGFNLTLTETGEVISLAGSWKIKAEYDLGPMKRFRPEVPRPGNKNSPSLLFDGMVRPLLPYGIRGVIWYQGESNAHDINESLSYRKKIATLIQDWRYYWEEGNFPFIQVQLAGYGDTASYAPGDAWPVLRETQSQVCGDLENVFMATAVDTGEQWDIHPQDKKSVGYRLAQAALNKIYHCPEITPCGPLFRSVEREDEWIRITFDYADGLNFKGGHARGFYLADTNKVFVPADEAVIEGNSVRLRSDKLSNPCAVRYAWANNPDGNLYNSADLPAFPFRSDSWTL